MADKNIKKPKGVNSSDWRAYLQALDEIENRPVVDEVEEVMAAHRKEREESGALFTGDWSENPNATDLGSLLIVPNDGEEENQDDAHHLVSMLLSNQPQDENGDSLPAAPVDQRNPLAVLAAVIFPRRGDSGAAIAVKSGLLLTAVAVLAALALLVNQMVLLPYANRQLNYELFELYDPENTMTVADTTRYPAGMLASFKELYLRNQDVRGWLSFHSSGDSDLINMEYPVVQTDNNKDYMSLDFDKKDNQNGTLFFDQKCRIAGVQDTSRVLMLYGNSTGNGQMLSGLTNLMGSVNNARAASVFTLSTLYEKADYYVMAVVLIDGDNTSLDYKRTLFADEQDFFDHVQAFRDRSLFNYAIDLQEGDQLAIIGTNVSEATGNMPDGRLLVLGRRQRPGETATDLSNVTKNEDVIMPYRWYVAQGRTPHDYYFRSDSDTTATQGTEDTALTETGDTNATTEATAEGDATTGESSATADDDTTGTGTAGEDTTAATDKNGSTTTINKNTYTTSHTYTEEPTTTTSRSVPTGMIVTKVPVSTESTEKTDAEDTTTTETTKPQE